MRRYVSYLQEQERAPVTIQKYVHDLTALLSWMNGQPLTKAALIAWKKALTADHAPATVNSMVAAVNGFLSFMGWCECKIKLLKIQKAIFCDPDKELTRAEYARLVRAAEQKENQRLSLIIQTICATGIRVSELRYITVQAVQTGRAEVSNKGKRRAVFLSGKLRRLLQKYLRTQKITAGAVFVTRSGKPVDRSNIWRDMKRLCESAGVEPEKVFPHNLRHLFARTYYAMERDLSRLADILGYSSVNTTRIYTVESGAVHARQVERMWLVLTT
ncbi:tyrosine-type recombinase/integrase [Pseudoflavonifractor sp. An184]|uniref:tyrosine-type recombinase/integrase n=1 Tax=Pseudoflavonifractor sp. An184 TaxID=1965576 RepID=UPI001FA8FE42|nr:tyrosine-type recombinase/integrase [Pseudoflavonifractor sp. An184]